MNTQLLKKQKSGNPKSRRGAAIQTIRDFMKKENIERNPALTELLYKIIGNTGPVPYSKAAGSRNIQKNLIAVRDPQKTAEISDEQRGQRDGTDNDIYTEIRINGCMNRKSEYERIIESADFGEHSLNTFKKERSRYKSILLMTDIDAVNINKYRDNHKEYRRILRRKCTEIRLNNCITDNR